MAGSIISLVSPPAELSAVEQWWRELVPHWPNYAQAPSPESIGLDTALCEPHQMQGAVAVVMATPGLESRTCVLKLTDLLDARMTPTVVLTDGATTDFADLASERVLVVPRTMPPDALAAAIYALSVRQPAVEALLAELKTVRRFHGGLRDEMDRLQEELQLAAHVQQQFIPRSLPEIDGLEFGVCFRPCGYVSGDIYDVSRITEDITGFFVADAVGHGVPAALMTMVLSKAMPSLDEDGALIGPAESLRRLNAALMKRTGRIQTFATAVCGVIDARTGEVTIAGAGHPPALRISATGIDRIETDGSLLGVFDDGEFNEVTCRLQLDEILLVHSDGFETAFPEPNADRSRRSPSQRYLDHFRMIRSRRAEAGLASAMTDLSRAIDEQDGSLHQVDDETALVIARRPRAAARCAA